jgi:hypothetical protein
MKFENTTIKGSQGATRRLLCLWFAGLLIIMALTTRESVGQDAKREILGTAASPSAINVPANVELAPMSAVAALSGASYATGGKGMRNQGAGAIVINGANPPIQAALIYWAVITNGPPTAADQSLAVQRQFPTPVSSIATVTGTVVGSGPQPCWSGTTITVFRGSIPLTVATGNGLYKVTLKSGASGTTNGADPWVAGNLPLFEGASIVLVGAGTGNVAVYDSGLSGATFNTSLSYSLILPTTATGALTLWDNIGADGQQGKSRTSLFAKETTTINGHAVAGPGSAYNDSDWNGSAGYPLPQLWDDTGHNVTAASPSGTTRLNVTFKTNNSTTPDCLTPVANVVEVH